MRREERRGELAELNRNPLDVAWGDWYRAGTVRWDIDFPASTIRCTSPTPRTSNVRATRTGDAHY